MTTAQLDATSAVAGTFTYVPPAGSALHAGSDTLSVTFAPTDTTHYTKVTTTVSIKVGVPNVRPTVMVVSAPSSVGGVGGEGRSNDNAADIEIGSLAFDSTNGQSLAAVAASTSVGDSVFRRRSNVGQVT